MVFQVKASRWVPAYHKHICIQNANMLVIPMKRYIPRSIESFIGNQIWLDVLRGGYSELAASPDRNASLWLSA